VLDSVLVDADLVCILVGFHEAFEKDVLELDGALEALVVWAHGGLQGDHVEAETLCCHHSLDELAESSLGTPGEKNTERIFLFVAQVDELYNLLVPPPAPCSWFFFGDAFARRGQDSGVVPPSAVDEAVGIREGAYGRSIPYLGIRQRSLEDCRRRNKLAIMGFPSEECGMRTGVVEVVDVNGLDGIRS